MYNMVSTHAHLKKFINLRFAALMFFSIHAYAYHTTWSYFCHPEQGIFQCCDNSVPGGCHKGGINFEPNSSLGKHSIGPQKTHTMRLQCNGNGKVGLAYHWHSSGGTIDCIQQGGGAGQYFLILSCHNSATKGGHVWLSSMYCDGGI